ncbi:hypothetical protein BGZ99_004220 [Dissophora globulifera]|uniref:Uncharacterized protein n=1 Tax=Dissophora globulifera TaxID=979702 RepID=A0A9P6RI97_9FUNG|nr:hypothetical protein BGZ99_004220 [Dissophora globulifera]
MGQGSGFIKATGSRLEVEGPSRSGNQVRFTTADLSDKLKPSSTRAPNAAPVRGKAARRPAPSQRSHSSQTSSTRSSPAPEQPQPTLNHPSLREFETKESSTGAGLHVVHSPSIFATQEWQSTHSLQDDLGELDNDHDEDEEGDPRPVISTDATNFFISQPQDLGQGQFSSQPSPSRSPPPPAQASSTNDLSISRIPASQQRIESSSDPTTTLSQIQPGQRLPSVSFTSELEEDSQAMNLDYSSDMNEDSPAYDESFIENNSEEVPSSQYPVHQGLGINILAGASDEHLEVIRGGDSYDQGNDSSVNHADDDMSSFMEDEDISPIVDEASSNGVAKLDFQETSRPSPVDGIAFTRTFSPSGVQSRSITLQHMGSYSRSVSNHSGGGTPTHAFSFTHNSNRNSSARQFASSGSSTPQDRPIQQFSSEKTISQSQSRVPSTLEVVAPEKLSSEATKAVSQPEEAEAPARSDRSATREILQSVEIPIASKRLRKKNANETDQNPGLNQVKMAAGTSHRPTSRETRLSADVQADPFFSASTSSSVPLTIQNPAGSQHSNSRKGYEWRDKVDDPDYVELDTASTHSDEGPKKPAFSRQLHNERASYSPSRSTRPRGSGSPSHAHSPSRSDIRHSSLQPREDEAHPSITLNLSESDDSNDDEDGIYEDNNQGSNEDSDIQEASDSEASYRRSTSITARTPTPVRRLPRALRSGGSANKTSPPSSSKTRVLRRTTSQATSDPDDDDSESGSTARSRILRGKNKRRKMTVITSDSSENSDNSDREMVENVENSSLTQNMDVLMLNASSSLEHVLESEPELEDETEAGGRSAGSDDDRREIRHLRSIWTRHSLRWPFWTAKKKTNTDESEPYSAGALD